MAKAKKNGEAKTDHGRGPNLVAGKRQLEIKGAERPSNPKLDAILAPFVDARYQRMELELEERRLHDLAISTMADLKIPKYVFRDGDKKYEIESVHVDAKDKLKVRRFEEASE
jgi:hypothetical protein